MATSQMSGVIQHLRRTVLLREGAGRTDGQLLEDYISRRDEAALAVLVRRHGPMVWGVCRRVLRSHHDAEDAFQATFFVLVRKAASIVPRQMVANWLYGVAHQTALNARATAAKRKGRERQVTEMPEPAVAEQDLWRDLQLVLDEELSRLPDKYRAVIVLCDLEGKTRKETARQLSVPEGTVGGWLARARRMLVKRLAQRGVALSGGGLAAVLARNAAAAGVPDVVVSGTIRAASTSDSAVGLLSTRNVSRASATMKIPSPAMETLCPDHSSAKSRWRSGAGTLRSERAPGRPALMDGTALSWTTRLMSGRSALSTLCNGAGDPAACPGWPALGAAAWLLGIW